MKYPLLAAIVAANLAIGAADSLADTATNAAAGGSHTCALTTAGGVLCWGYNWSGQLGDGTTTQRSTPVAVSGLESGVAAIAAGGAHTCALTTSGGVLCWGGNYAGQLGDGTTTQRLTPTAVSGLGSGVVAITAGETHTCAVTTGGGVACWGSNDRGQLGDGTTTDRVIPTAVNGLGGGVAEISAGRWHSCALTTAGGVVCWGYNGSGELGDGTTTQRLTPTAVSGLSDGVAAIAAGHYHTCALTTGGGVLCWGSNGEGQLGNGTTTQRSTPVAVSGLESGVAAIVAGGGYTCALTTGGGVLCWGWNGDGELGDGTTTNRLTPTAVSGLSSGVAAIAAGSAHTCAVTTTGSVVCWGWNGVGQLGDGTAIRHPAPTAVSGLGSGVAALEAGAWHTCALMTSGAAVCWGYNWSGQLGDGTTTGRSTPTPVSGLGSGVVAITAGESHTCALTTSGGVVCWGYNSNGQLGDGTTTQRSTPVAVSGLESGVAAIAAGEGHTCALTTAGGLVCWGRNSYGQLGDGTTTRRLTPTPVSGLESGAAAIVAGYAHTCALTTSGGVLCWGYNVYGQLGDGTTTVRSLTPTPVSGLGSSVAAIAAGGYHACALTTAGGVLCWGRNVHGELGDGTTTQRLTPTAVSGLASGVAAISAGQYHTCALTTGGGVMCWGDSSQGQLGDGTTTQRLTPTAVSGLGSGVAAIAAGGSHTCAVATSGGVLCWGGDGDGQLGLGSRVVATLPIGVYNFGGAISASSISPATGPAAGGTAVTISGAYFLQGATVTIGGVPATNVVVVNTETITATAGAHMPGAVDVAIQNPDGAQTTLAVAFTYGAANAPSDFNGDLKSDILWHHATRGEVWLWPMDGAARTGEIHVRTVGDTNWEIRGVGDQTGDGKADILWRNKTTGAIYFWPMDGSTPLSETYVGTVDPAYDIVGTGDFDGDGKSDILWRHLTNGEVWIWLMDGATPLSQVWVGTVDPAYVIKGVGDLNGDGQADIVWHHATVGEVWVWLMEGTTGLSQTWVATVPDVGYQIAGVADYDGDGKADILWHDAITGEVWLWRMDGPTRLAETWVGTVADTNYRIVNTGDYDGDGKADILWHHATAGEVWVWLMNGTVRRSQTWVGTVPDVGYQIVKIK